MTRALAVASLLLLAGFHVAAGAPPAVPAPQLTLSTDEVVFDTVFAGTSILRTLTVTNTGRETVTMGEVSTDHDAFRAEYRGRGDQDAFDLWPGYSIEILVYFSPDAPDTYDGRLTIVSELPQMSVRLLGTAVDPPVLALDADTLTAELDAGTTTTRSFTISNEGASPLRWVGSLSHATPHVVLDASPAFAEQRIAPEAAGKTALSTDAPDEALYRSEASPAGVTTTLREHPALDSVLARFDAHAAAVAAAVPNRFDFSEGVTGYEIRDGGQDMYDYGNRLRVDGASISYSDGAVREGYPLGIGGGYFTRKVPGLFVMAADLDGVENFRIEGWLGNGGSGSVDGAVLETTVAGRRFQVFAKRVYDAGTPSVNHVIVIERSGTATHSFATDTRYDQHTVSGLRDTERLYYLLFAGREGAYVDDEAVVGVVDAFLGTIGVRPPWLRLSAYEGRVAPGASTTVTATFDASYRTDSTYAGRIRFNTNDPARSTATIEARLHVRGAPHLSVEPTSLAFDSLFAGDADSLRLTLSNTGSADVSITDVAVDDPGFAVEGPTTFTLEPGASETFGVRFTPETARAYEAMLTVTSDELDDVTVPLTGVALDPPIASVSPDAFTLDVQSGDSLTRTLTLSNTGGSDLVYEVQNPPSMLQIFVNEYSPQDGMIDEFYALDPETGAAIDTFEFTSPPGVDGSAYAGGYLLYAYLEYVYPLHLHPESRGQGWSLDRYHVSELAHSGEEVFAMVSDTSILALDPHDGAIRRTIYLEEYVNAYNMLTYGGDRHTLFVMSQWREDNVIIEASPYDGRTLREIPLADANEVTALAYSQTLGMLLVARGNTIEIVDPNDGQVQRSIQSPVPVHELVGDETGYFPFVQAHPAVGHVPVGGDVALDMTIAPGNQPAGTYSDTLYIATNDPQHPRLDVPVTLHVEGVPRLSVSPDSLAYDTLFVGATQTQVLAFANRGTDTLHVSDLAFSNEAYRTDAALPLAVAPRGSVDVDVTFAPSAAGDIAATLTVTSDDPDGTHTVVLRGTALEPPVASVRPESISAELAVGDTLARTLTLSNSGGSALTYTARFADEPQAGRFIYAIADDGTHLVRRSIEGSTPPSRIDINPPLPHPVGMTTDGEHLYLNGWDSEEEQAIIRKVDPTTGATIRETAMHATFYVDALAFDGQRLMALGAYSNTGHDLLIEIDMASDVHLNPVDLDRWYASTLTFTGRHGRLFAGAWEDGAPVLVELDPEDGAVLGESAIDVPSGSPGHFTSLTYSSGRDVLLAALSNDPEHVYALDLDSGEIRYTLPGSATRAMAADEWPTSVAVATVAPLRGTVEPGASVELDVRLDATDVFGGTYMGDVEISTNDPANDTLRVPVTLTVTGTPALTLSADTLDFGQVLVGRTDSLTLTMHSTGTDSVRVSAGRVTGTAFVADASSAVLGDDELHRITVHFAPTEASAFADTLRFTTNVPGREDVAIALRGTGFDPPILEMPHDSITVRIAQGSQASETLTLYNAGGSPLQFTAWSPAYPSAERPLPPEPSVLLIQERKPWDFDFARLLRDSLGVEPRIASPMDLFESELDSFDVVVTSEDQGEGYEEELFIRSYEFDRFVFNGGRLLYLIGETEATFIHILAEMAVQDGVSSSHDRVTARNHPIGWAIPTPRSECGSVDRILTELPPATRILTTNSSGDATTLAFQKGDGLAVATTMPWIKWYARNCEGGRMLLNALRYVLDPRPSLPWIEFAPSEGVVPAHDSLEITVTMHAGNLSTGWHLTDVFVEADGHGESVAQHSVLMEVTERTSSDVPSSGLPERYALHAAYPNPFNPATTLAYDVPEPSDVTLAVYDVLGREVARLVDEKRPAGRYTLSFDAARLSSGTYYVRMRAGDYVKVQSLVLVK